MTNTDAVQGRCLCGGVAWEAGPPFSMMSHCHCSMCRKSHGTAFATYVAARAENYRMKQGEALITRYASSPQGVRCFCSICGSITPSPVEGELVFMPAGPLEGELGLRPQAHIFVGSKAPWYEISDGLPKFDAYPPGLGLSGVERSVQSESKSGWVQGSCLCGDVAYEIAIGDANLMQCHCSRCRRGRAAAHGTNLFIPAERFHWLRGAANLRSHRVPEAQRHAQVFCPRCGSCMPRDAGPMFVVPAGALDGDPGIVDRKHIFVGSKAAWFTITDSTPQYETLPQR